MANTRDLPDPDDLWLEALLQTADEIEAMRIAAAAREEANMDANNPSLLWIGSPGKWILDGVDLLSCSYVAQFDAVSGYADAAMSCLVFALLAEPAFLTMRDAQKIDCVQFRVPTGPNGEMQTHRMDGPWVQTAWQIEAGGLVGRTVRIDLRRHIRSVFEIAKMEATRTDTLPPPAATTAPRAAGTRRGRRTR